MLRKIIRIIDKPLVLKTMKEQKISQYSAVETPALFSGTVDRYKGVTVISSEVDHSGVDIEAKLKASLEEWDATGIRAVWFKVKLEQSHMIPHLVNCGFHYHHALSDTAVLLKWLPSEEECPIPPFCHTMIGVGGIVVDEEDNILTVQEKFQQKKYWKLPGGYVEPGEDLGDAAIREVFEETGIKTEFRSVLGMRHVHGFNFDSSDMYFIVQLAPLNKETVRCEKEILDVKWMPVRTFFKLSVYTKIKSRARSSLHTLKNFFSRFLVQPPIMVAVTAPIKTEVGARLS